MVLLFKYRDNDCKSSILGDWAIGVSASKEWGQCVDLEIQDVFNDLYWYLGVIVGQQGS